MRSEDIKTDTIEMDDFPNDYAEDFPSDYALDRGAQESQNLFDVPS